MGGTSLDREKPLLVSGLLQGVLAGFFGVLPDTDRIQFLNPADGRLDANPSQDTPRRASDRFQFFAKSEILRQSHD